LGLSAIGVAGGVLFTFKDEQSYTKTDEYYNYQVGFAAYPYPRCEVNVRGKEFFSLSLYDSANAAEHVTSTNWRWSLLTPDTKLSDIAP
jgi:hypothetical protein